ncbi:ankyrin repeat-containing domain protein [Lophiotrema nucula]|uniref:Ankyrin repeat-containing domain protein n=1 Tax=Lophiotrema nucula TaxID=690887 RepID=A0A6A5YGW1_9PLEO|nr:ankyrin repeat-containing domain protein [Lophiotrema nucula]
MAAYFGFMGWCFYIIFAGSGKSVLCSAIIQRLQAEGDSMPLAYFYFDRTEVSKRSASHLLSAILFQLMNQDKQCLSAILSWVKAANSASAPMCQKPATFPTLETITVQALKSAGAVLVVDAVDEGDSSREIISLLVLLANIGAKVMFTSRSDITTRRIVEECEPQAHSVKEIRISADAVTQDIQTFLLAYCHISSLPEYLSDRDIRHSLDQLPVGLYSAYDHMIEQLEASFAHNKRLFALASRLFQWITFSFRPLTLSELCAAISIEKDDLELDESNVITDPWNILKIGGSMLAYDYESERVTFAHPTVRDYLLQRGSGDQPPYQIRICASDPHIPLAASCIQYLQFSSVSLQMRNLDYRAVQRTGQLHESQFAFLHYAGQFWEKHVQHVSTLDEEEVSSRLRHFLIYSKGSFEIWQGVYAASPKEPVSGKVFGPLALALSKIEKQGARGRWGIAESAPAEFIGAYSSNRRAYQSAFSEAPRQAPNRTRDTRSSEDRVLQYIFNWNRGVLSPLHVLSKSGFPAVLREALQSGLSPNVQGGLLNKTPLHEAVESDLMRNIRLLLESGADINGADSLGRTPLFYASKAGNTQVVDLLLEHRPKTDQADWYGNSPLHEAAREGHEHVVRTLLDHSSDLTTPNASKNTALDLALEKGRVDVSVMLLDSGASIRPLNVVPLLKANSKPLLQAIIQRFCRNTEDQEDSRLLTYGLATSTKVDHLELLRKLLSLGLPLNNEGCSGDNTLCWTIAKTSSQESEQDMFGVSYIWPSGLETTDDESLWYFDDTTKPLKSHIVVSQKLFEGFEMLLSYGALCKQTTGTTCLHHAAQFGDSASALSERLLAAGCELEATTPEGRNAFLEAVHCQALKLASSLLTAGADPRIGKSEVPSFLDVLVTPPDFTSTKELLVQLMGLGLCLNATDSSGRTILHKFCLDPTNLANLALVEWVIEQGGDPSLTDDEGNTPLHILFGEKLTHWFRQYQVILLKVIWMMIRSMRNPSVPNSCGQTPLMVLMNMDLREYSIKDIEGYGNIVLSLQDNDVKQILGS